MNLHKAPLNTPLKISSLREGLFFDRLRQMGLTPGSEISVVRGSILGGPIVVNLGTSLIGLRLEEASYIQVIENKK